MLRIIFKAFIVTTILNQYECTRHVGLSRQPENANWEFIKKELVHFGKEIMSLENVYDKNPPNLIEYYKQALQNRCFKYIFLMIYFSRWAFWQLHEQLDKKTELCEKLLDAVIIISNYTSSKVYIPYLFNIQKKVEEMCGNLAQSDETLVFIFEEYLTWFPAYVENGRNWCLGRTFDERTKEIFWKKFDSVAKGHLKYWPPRMLNEELLGEDDTEVEILYQRIVDEIPRKNDTFIEDLMNELKALTME